MDYYFFNTDVSCLDGKSRVGVLIKKGIAATSGERSYGEQLGMAFQIVDDILDFTATSEELGKPAGSDLLAGTVTLPTLLYMERSPENNPVRRAFDGVRRKANLQRAIDEIRASDLLEESMVTARRFADRALEALAELPPGDPRNHLEALVEYVLTRRS